MAEDGNGNEAKPAKGAATPDTEEEGTELVLEGLYRRYCVRLKHALFVSALCVTLLCCTVLLCAVCILHSHELSKQVISISSLSVINFVLIIVLCLALLPAAPEWEAFALTGSVLVTVGIGAGTLYVTHHAPLPLFALILMVHTMMPIARSIALSMSGILTLAYIVLAFFVGQQVGEKLFYQQLICEFFLLASATGIGLYYRALTERAHRNTFAGTRTCLEQRVKLECEREQQERLLLSVIPAYIAAEMWMGLVAPRRQSPLLQRPSARTWYARHAPTVRAMTLLHVMLTKYEDIDLFAHCWARLYNNVQIFLNSTPRV